MPKNNGLAVNQAIEGLSFLGVLNDCLVCGVLCLDEQGRISSLTPEAGRMLRVEAPQMLGEPYEVLPAPLASLLRDALATDGAFQYSDVELCLNEGATTIVRVNVIRPGGAFKNPSVIVVLNELAAARRMEFDIGRLDRLSNIGVLSASMAHEIKNALVAVKTFTDMVLVRQPGVELGDVALRELKRIESIVSQMLKFAGPSQPRLAPMRIHEILDHSLRLAQHQMVQKAIRLRREYEAAADWVNGDDYQLEQAFVNLILNGVEAMGVGGTLTVATRVLARDRLPATLREENPAPGLSVTISDTGVGIPAENMGRMFEPFFTTKREGTGLGLAITRRILDEHRAAILVESEVSRGSSFRVFFAPLQRG